MRKLSLVQRTSAANSHSFGPTLALFSLISMATFAWHVDTLAQVSPSWTITGNLNIPRSGHTATPLLNGEVLVVGGGTAELYDPATGTWSITANLHTVHDSHTATLLQNGKVLVAGGSSAELYDPNTGTWTITGSLNIARSWYTATLLQSGKVLVAGGWGNDSLSSSELYDPNTGTWSMTGSLIDDTQSRGLSPFGPGHDWWFYHRRNCTQESSRTISWSIDGRSPILCPGHSSESDGTAFLRPDDDCTE